MSDPPIYDIEKFRFDLYRSLNIKARIEVTNIQRTIDELTDRLSTCTSRLDYYEIQLNNLKKKGYDYNEPSHSIEKVAS